MTWDKLVFDILHIRNKPSENPGFYNVVYWGHLRTSKPQIDDMKSYGLTHCCHCYVVVTSLTDPVGELELIVAMCIIVPVPAIMSASQSKTDVNI